MVIGGFGGKICRSMCNVIGCPMVFIQKFVYPRASMLMRIAGLEEMILASCMGDGILGDVIHWKMDMFYFFS